MFNFNTEVQQLTNRDGMKTIARLGGYEVAFLAHERNTRVSATIDSIRATEIGEEYRSSGFVFFHYDIKAEGGIYLLRGNDHDTGGRCFDGMI